MRRLLVLLVLFTTLSSLPFGSATAQDATPVAPEPALVAPRNGSLIALPVELQWFPISDTGAYQVEMSFDSVFAEVLLSESTRETSFTLDLSLVPEVTYFWRVWFVPESGSPTVSETWSFQVSSETPATETPESAPSSTPDPATPIETATMAPPTDVAITVLPTSTPTSVPTQTRTASATATSTATKAAEPTPVTRSELSGKRKRAGYALTAVGRSSGSVHPSAVVDGNLSTIWTSPATHPDSAYFVLALDSVQPIGTIQWLFGKSGHADQVRISVSNDRATWAEVGRVRNATIGEWQTLAVNRDARFIRFLVVNIRGDRWLGGLVEVEALPPVAKPEPTATKAPASPTPIADGIVRNASFEQGRAGWYLESGSRISSTSARGGKRSLAMSSSGGYADQRVLVQSGKSYALTAWGRLTRSWDIGQLGVVYRDANGRRLFDLEPAPIEFTRTRFTSGRLEFTIPASVRSVTVFVWKQDGGAGFFVDDIRLRQIDTVGEEQPKRTGSGCQQLIVPGYFDPRTTSLWKTTTDSGSAVGMVIVNPNSGVDDEYDAVWSDVVADARSAGFTVLGYVQTDYGSRSSAAVIAEIAQYRSWYGITDFFLDEASIRFGDLERYRAMVANVHTNGGIAVLNFGQIPHPAYMEFTDVAVAFEGSYALYENGFGRPSWVYNYSPDRFLHIVHSTPAAKWSDVIDQSRERNAGLVWVTDDDTVSYYKSLPSFWSKLNKSIKKSC